MLKGIASYISFSLGPAGPHKVRKKCRCNKLAASLLHLHPLSGQKLRIIHTDELNQVFAQFNPKIPGCSESLALARALNSMVFSVALVTCTPSTLPSHS